uniref:Uncharacterized protein n=1 Tax=Tanacetum cinerariifolium TaxID=118510 RepID=A0A6L2L678_TANCI|nr:hypothetical protein [Tanacetum cinerariifolium]
MCKVFSAIRELVNVVKKTLELGAQGVEEDEEVLLQASFVNVKEIPTADMICMTSMIELENLFGPSFDEYFNGENQVVSESFVVTTADESDNHQQQPDSTSSTSALATTVTADGNFDM